jgi:hypothetical protein
VGQTESKTHQASTPGRSQSNIYYLHKTLEDVLSYREQGCLEIAAARECRNGKMGMAVR